MKKIKISLAGISVIMMLAFSFTVNAKPDVIDCSTLPNGRGILKDHLASGCIGDTDVCCYRLTDNFVYRYLP